MSAPTAEPSLAHQVRRLQELVRRLSTRLPAASADPVEPWQSMLPYLGPGWTTDGTVNVDWYHARFYADRERVFFAGNIYYVGGGNAVTPVSNLFPVAYRPTMLTNARLSTDGDNTGGTTVGLFWEVDILPSPLLSALWHLDGRPTAPTFPPAFTYFFLDDLSYRT